MLVTHIVIGAAVFTPGVLSQTDPCAQYTNEAACEDTSPASSNCVWASRTPGGDQTPSSMICRTFGCMDISQSAENPQAECENFGGCTWNQDAYYCGPTGEPVPCSLNYDQSSCASPCVWDDTNGMCNSAGYQAPCDGFYDETSCPSSRCTWTAPTDPNSMCEGVCSEGAPSCAAYRYAEQTCCPANCNWVQVGSDGGQCREPGEEIACEDYTDVDSCDAPRCLWHPDSYMCTAADRQIPCAQQEQSSCQASAACRWVENSGTGAGDDDVNGYCRDCRNGNNCTQAVTTPTDSPPDNGAACSTYSTDSCPEPRCFSDYSSGDVGCGNGLCRPAQCRDFISDQGSCSQLTSCAYESTEGICYNTTASVPYPCDEVFEESGCSSSNGCAWQAPATSDGVGICYVQAQGIPCSSYSSTDASSCPSPQCHWEPTQQKCMNAGEEPSCASYGSSGGCPTDRCQITMGYCWPQGETIPCSAFCDAFPCTNSGQCQWSEQSYSCSPCNGACSTPQPCSSYTSVDTCPESSCAWVFNDEAQGGSAGTCSDKQCTEIYTGAECAAKGGCTWNPTAFSCFPSGIDPPCSMQYDQASCSSPCQWNEEAYACLDAGEVAPCHYFYQQPCPAGCEWNQDQDTCELPLSNQQPPQLNGGGSHDPSQCSDSQLDQYMPLLDQANTECSYDGDRRRHRRQSSAGPSADQLKCLEYIVVVQGGTTLQAICPCLWRWASEIYPEDDHWFELNC